MESIHPLPETRNEYMLGQLMALVAGMFSKGKKPKVTDFMLSSQMAKNAEKPMTWEQQFRAAFSLAKGDKK